MSSERDLSKPIWAYGVLSVPVTKKRRCHAIAYLEYEIPKKLAKELEGIIDKKLDHFYKKCKCDFCKETRKPKK